MQCVNIPLVRAHWHNGIMEPLHNHAQVSVRKCMLHHEWKKDQSTHMSSSLVSLQSVDSAAVH